MDFLGLTKGHACYLILILLIFCLNAVSMECPQNSSEWRQREITFSCPGGTPYHCLPDENGLATESCLERTWVQPGFCPELNSVSRKMDVSLCQESRGKCPLRVYWSNDVFMYTACMPANYIRNVSVTGSRPTSRYAVKGTTPHATTSRNASTERKQSGDTGNEVSVAVIIVPIIVVLLLCGVAAALLLWYRRRRLKNDKSEKLAEPSTSLPLIKSPSTCKTDDEPAGTTLPLINTPSTCTTDIGKLHKEQEAKQIETENFSKEKKKPETVTAPVALQASDGKKLSKDDKFEYSGNIAEKVGDRLKKNGILLLVCQSKKFMADVGQSLALTCDTQEFPSGFKDFLDSFVEMEKSNKKTKCVVFNDCFQKEGKSIKFSDYKSVFNELYEIQVNSEGRIRFVIAIPTSLWNSRKLTLSRWNLFNEKYIFKINNPD